MLDEDECGGGGVRCDDFFDFGELEEEAAAEDYTKSPGFLRLSAEQRAIVTLPAETNVVVLAAPGSGKTTTILARVRWLIEEAGVPAGGVVVITYSKALAGEVEEHFDAEDPDLRKRLFFVGTIDALAARLIKSYDRRYRTFGGADVIDELDVARAIPHATFTHVFIDEGQDLNPKRAVKIAGLLRGRVVETADGRGPDYAGPANPPPSPSPPKTVCVVGDPRQTIYRRLFGADPRLMLQLVENLPAGSGPVRTMYLTQTRRLTPEVVAFVNYAFAGLEGQPPMRSAKPLSGQKVRLVRLHAKATYSMNRPEVVRYIAEWIVRWSSPEVGGKPGDLMVLMPSVRSASQDLINSVRVALAPRGIRVFLNASATKDAVSSAWAPSHDAVVPYKDEVYVGTVHSAKGRERPRVLLVNFYAGGGAYYTDSEDFMSQAFVACTRATKSLELLENCHYPEQNEPMPFMRRVPVKILDLCDLAKKQTGKASYLAQVDASLIPDPPPSPAMVVDSGAEEVPPRRAPSKVWDVGQLFDSVMTKWPAMRRSIANLVREESGDRDSDESANEDDGDGDLRAGPALGPAEAAAVPPKLYPSDAELYHSFLRVVFTDAVADVGDPNQRTCLLAQKIRAPMVLTVAEAERVARAPSSAPESRLAWSGHTAQSFRESLGGCGKSAAVTRTSIAKVGGAIVYAETDALAGKLDSVRREIEADFAFFGAHPVFGAGGHSPNRPTSMLTFVRRRVSSPDDETAAVERAIRRRVALLWDLVLCQAYRSSSLGIYWFPDAQLTTDDLLPIGSADWTAFYRVSREALLRAAFDVDPSGRVVKGLGGCRPDSDSEPEHEVDATPNRRGPREVQVLGPVAEVRVSANSVAALDDRLQCSADVTVEVGQETARHCRTRARACIVQVHAAPVTLIDMFRARTCRAAHSGGCRAVVVDLSGGFIRAERLGRNTRREKEMFSQILSHETRCLIEDSQKPPPLKGTPAK